MINDIYKPKRTYIIMSNHILGGVIKNERNLRSEKSIIKEGWNKISYNPKEIRNSSGGTS